MWAAWAVEYGLLHFHVEGHTRWPNLALVFFALILCCAFVFRRNVCSCCVRFSFFSTSQEDWLRRTSLKWPVLCRVGCKTLAQSWRGRMALGGGDGWVGEWAARVGVCVFVERVTAITSRSAFTARDCRSVVKIHGQRGPHQWRACRQRRHLQRRTLPADLVLSFYYVAGWHCLLLMLIF